MSLAPLKHEGRLSASVSGVWDQDVLLDLGWLRSVTYKLWRSASGSGEMPPVLGRLVPVQFLSAPAEQHGGLW